MRTPIWSLALTLGLLAARPVTSRGQGVPVTEFRARRDGALARLPHSILIVRGRTSFAADPEPGLHQPPDFYYYTGLENIVGAVLLLDGGTRQTWLLLPERVPRIAGFVPSVPPDLCRLGNQHCPYTRLRVNSISQLLSGASEA